jgi:hypothetical protein
MLREFAFARSFALALVLSISPLVGVFCVSAHRGEISSASPEGPKASKPRPSFAGHLARKRVRENLGDSLFSPDRFVTKLQAA